MIKKLKKIAKKILHGKYANSTAFVKYLRKEGCTIGERTMIYEPKNTYIDQTRPWLINIGDDVKITRGVTILTHGYDWSVMRNVYHDLLGSSGKVVIGNNVFIGMNSTILKGVTVGNNVIIGANALVNKDIPDNVVVAGNPARVVMSLEDYYKKRQNEYADEAKELAVEYYHRYKRIPSISVIGEFFMLFLERDLDVAASHGFTFMIDGTEANDLKQTFLNTQPIFNGYEDFLEWCGITTDDKQVKTKRDDVSLCFNRNSNH